MRRGYPRRARGRTGFGLFARTWFVLHLTLSQDRVALEPAITKAFAQHPHISPLLGNSSVRSWCFYVYYIEPSYYLLGRRKNQNPYLGINRAWTCCALFVHRFCRVSVNQRERGRHMFGRIIRFQKISFRFYSTNARTRMEDPRPPWVYVMSRLLSFTVIPSMHRLFIQQSFIVDEFRCSRNSILSVLS